MHRVKPYYFFFLLLALPILFLQNTGCEKEYSFEGIDTARIQPDTISIQPPVVVSTFPQCQSCQASEELLTGTWNFETGNAYLCGTFTNSGFIGGYSKTDFTFFGPSACSVDTGIVVSVYLPVPLDQDRFNISSSSSAFYYYDNHAPKDIFDSSPLTGFTVTVQSFILSTRIATGIFSGTAYKPNGDTVNIINGKFKAELK
jgi:hypothetical protein